MKAFIKWILPALLLFFTCCLTQEDYDEVTVTSEGEENESEEEVTYSSPVPSGRVYLAESFDDPQLFRKKWIISQAKKDDTDENIAKYDGKWEVEPAQRHPLRGDMGLVMKSRAKHSAISAHLDRPFRFEDKPLIVQYEVNMQVGQECGGAYLKLLSHEEGPRGVDLLHFRDKTPYTIMFGPDKCGNDHKLHFIFRHKNPLNGTYSEKHCRKPKDRVEEPMKDKRPHLYTLIVRPDNSFEVRVDHKVVNEGSLLEDFNPEVNPPAEIDDPTDSQPVDWDDREKIPDPEAEKPDDWDEDAPAQLPDESAVKPDGWLDDEPQMIPDPTAKRPEDWDDDMDGEWEAPLVPNPLCEGAPGCGEWKRPMVPNPAYRGKWRPPMIDNPAYRGKWAPRKIPNPDYFHDEHPFKMTPISAVGFELWSMSDLILFDNILVTDDLAVADQWAADTFDLKKKKLDQDTEGLIMRIISYTNAHPWLWALYLVVVALPLVLLLVFCCSSSQESTADNKKTDGVTLDAEGKEDGGEDEEEEDGVSGGERNKDEDDEEDDEEEEGGEGSKGQESDTKDDGKKGDEGEEIEEADVTEVGPERSSPRRRRPRKE
ncbi:calnexin-like isoform X2 [Ischnura elegans]|uniref:calnexin-like isoform X2 n=1 Tax=Ischnura elegans TaxID=197161 RepID=UPI001ED877A0|nr:calnexin-like isoform X2 [Ischnura elegans]